MTSRKDFISQDYFRNQADAIARLRAQGPVLQVHFPIIGKVWITTTSEVAGRVLKDSETFTLRKADGSLGGIAWWLPPSMRAMADNMLTMDEPDHTRLRQIVDEAFRQAGDPRHGAAHPGHRRRDGGSGFLRKARRRMQFSGTHASCRWR